MGGYWPLADMRPGRVGAGSTWKLMLSWCLGGRTIRPSFQFVAAPHHVGRGLFIHGMDSLRRPSAAVAAFVTLTTA